MNKYLLIINSYGGLALFLRDGAAFLGFIVSMYAALIVFHAFIQGA